MAFRVMLRLGLVKVPDILVRALSDIVPECMVTKAAPCLGVTCIGVCG